MKAQAEATRDQVVVAQAVAAVAVAVKGVVVAATRTTNRIVIRMVVPAETTTPVPLVKILERATSPRPLYTIVKEEAIVIVETNDMGGRKR